MEAKEFLMYFNESHVSPGQFSYWMKKEIIALQNELKKLYNYSDKKIFMRVDQLFSLLLCSIRQAVANHVHTWSRERGK